MSEFKNIKVKGNDNQIGDGNKKISIHSDGGDVEVETQTTNSSEKVQNWRWIAGLAIGGFITIAVAWLSDMW